jgi:prepilin-type N-terminal cleavage/methylation domain-containing protein
MHRPSTFDFRLLTRPRSAPLWSARSASGNSASPLNPEPRTLNPLLRPAFTLTELLITISIIALLAGLGLAALGGATELAREQRTGTMIDKIDQFIRERHEEYRTRAVPIKMPTSPTQYPAFYALPVYRDAQNNIAVSRGNAMLRLLALRALMRMELPDRRTDIVNFGVNPPSLETPGATNFINFYPTPVPTPDIPYRMQAAALQKTYFRMAIKALGGNPNDSTTFHVLVDGGPSRQGWTAEYEGAECLYLIIRSMRDGDKQAIDYFSADEIGDVDEDGMQEILDGWGTPITFLRWAPGYCEQKGADGEWGRVGVDDDGNGTTDDFSEWNYPGSDDGVFLVPTMQTRNYIASPDPFDPARVDPRWRTAPPYALHPLILSAGPDRKYDIKMMLEGGSFRCASPAATASPNDPYFLPAREPQLGTPHDDDGDGTLSFNDNLTNHAQQAP